ncbi:MAG: tyrosine-type recombinase/integrase [Candidatus Dormibacteria bacterium]
MEAELTRQDQGSEPVPAAERTVRHPNPFPNRGAGGPRPRDGAFETVLERFTKHLVEVECHSVATGRTYAKWAHHYYWWLAGAHPALPIDLASPEVLREFFACKRAQGLRASTLTTLLHSLRSFYGFVLAHDSALPNPTAGIRVPRVVAPAVDPYSEAEVRTLLAFARKYERSEDHRRWVGYVAVTVLAGTGVRNGELVSLKTADVDVVRHQLSVLGKGSKPRTVPFGPATATVLLTYLGELRPLLPVSPYFIVNPRSLRHGPHRGRMEPNALAGLVRDLVAEVGLPGRHFPHRFRHTFATNALREVRNIEVVRELLGHSDITTTGRYLHATMADKHEAADRIDFATATTHPTPGYRPPPGPKEEVTGAAFRLPPPKSGLSSSGSLPSRQLGAQAEERLGEALAAARRLPAETVSRLTSARIVEAAIGTLTVGPADTDVLAAAGAVILSRANQLPVSLEPLLRTHGAAALAAIEQARRALELLAESPGVRG